MLTLSAAAARAVAKLEAHYERTDRPEAVRNLRLAIERARDRIEQDPDAGLPFPRPYPQVARNGTKWIKQGRYWFAYRLLRPPRITAVIYDQANLPGRL